MKHVATSVDIDAPAARVWELISQFRHWPSWGPTVRSVRSRSAAVALGVTGSVVTPIGVRLPFVITEATGGESWAWRVGGVESTTHRVVDLGGRRSRLEFTVPVVFVPYVAVLRVGLRRIKAIAESGPGSS